MKEKYKNIREKLYGLKDTKNNYLTLICWILFGLLGTLAIELVQVGNIHEVAKFAINNNLEYIVNTSFIWFATLPIFFIKRKGFHYFLVATILGGFSVANQLIMTFRGTPLTFSDMYLVKEGLAIANKFLDARLVTMLLIILLVAFLLLIGIWVVERRRKGFSGIIVTALAVTLVVASMMLGETALNNGKINMHPWDLPFSYKENGFFLSFVNSYTAYKRNKPESIEYSSRTVELIKDDLADGVASESLSTFSNEAIATSSGMEGKSRSGQNTPNIIMIQLEAFFDPLTLEGVEFNEDPISNFRKLTNEYTSGNINVSTFGGGTARSDFESQTGLAMNYLAPGEIPYNTILKEQVVESVAQILKPYGYNSTAIHNGVGNYYQRNTGFANLGFDNYISKEYMTNVECTEVGWPKDAILTENIKDALMSTEGRDYIFTLTLQTHSSYSNQGIENKGIYITSDIDEIYRDEVEYYVNELKEVDDFIGDLIEMVNSIEEPAIIAFYSDHLPGLNILNNIQDKYIVPYVIYDNISLEKEDEDLALYQLSAKILESVGIYDGIMPQIHRQYKSNENYQNILEVIQYDILFGKHYYVDYKEIYHKSELKMGVNPITIDNVKVEVDYQEKQKIIAVLGENFVQYRSAIFIDNIEYPTEFVDDSTIICKIPLDKKIEYVEVKQIGQYNAALSSTEKFLVEKADS